MAELNALSLPAVAARGVAVPDYPRTGPAGVVHLGLGAFHRAHQALVFDALLRRGDGRWGVLGVAMHSTLIADALAAQDGLYAVQTASITGASWQVSAAVWQTCVAAREAARVHQALAAPATRWVTLTVTEKGYGPELDTLLVQGLALRRAAGLGGLTIASCDNLGDNGRKLEALCLAAARSQDPTLADWIHQACRFPNSMVDRIVPASSPACKAAASLAMGVEDRAPLSTEAFWEWVIERRFVDPADADALTRVGMAVVDDVAPFEEAKLRLLNGSHTAMACIGAVVGLPVVNECMDHQAIHLYIHGLMTHEVGPLVRRPDWPRYRDALLQRFANPALQHSVHQIASDSSQKIPQRWVPCIQAALQAGLPVDRLAFAAAAWMRYLRGADERGKSYTMHDPMAAELHALALAQAHDPQASVQALGTLCAIWGDSLPADEPWLARIGHWLTRITQDGLLNAMDQLNSTAAPPRTAGTQT